MAPKRIASAVQMWKKELPTVKPFYAVKCNPDPKFLSVLFDHGLGFDCASERELVEIHQLSQNIVDISSKVVYANPCKSARDLAAAAALGSPVTVVDSVEEIEKLSESQYTGGALIRLAVDDTGSPMPFSSKFGAAPNNIGSITAAARNVGIELRGISFHVGSGCKGGAAFSKAIIESAAALEIIRTKLYPNANILDIGGGFLPVPTDFCEKAHHIREALASLPSPLEVWAEPGRFFATDSFDFFVQVIGKKPGSDGWKYTIDDSIYGQFTNILFDQAKPTWTRLRNEGEKVRTYSKGTLFGRTCDSLDVIAKAEMEELEIGDWLWFPKMGAYTRATASEFNGFPRPESFFLAPEQDLPNPEQDGSPRELRHPSPITVSSLMS
jgi:ornithine decarboxylase